MIFHLFKTGFCLLAIACCFNSCSKKIHLSYFSHSGSYALGTGKDTLHIRFLGTTCFLFTYKDNAVLTDPFISNPSARKVTFGKIIPDTAIIYDYVSPAELNKVRMVTVGHGHYDHLMDLPVMAKHIPADAKITGSATAHHLTAAAQLPQEKINAEEFTATLDSTGQRIFSSDFSIQILPVVADHPPHALGLTLYGGNYEHDLPAVPQKAKKWKMGEPFAYLIDFLEPDGSIAYRIWFQSSGAEYPKGFFPESILAEKPVDVGFYSTANKAPLHAYPGKIVAFTKPRIIFMAHWENFLRDKYKPVKTVQKGNQKKIYEYLHHRFGREAKVVMPHPKGEFRVF